MTLTLSELKKEFYERWGAFYGTDTLLRKHYSGDEIWDWFEQKYSLSYQSGVRDTVDKLKDGINEYQNAVNKLLSHLSTKPETEKV